MFSTMYEVVVNNKIKIFLFILIFNSFGKCDLSYESEGSLHPRRDKNFICLCKDYWYNTMFNMRKNCNYKN